VGFREGISTRVLTVLIIITVVFFSGVWFEGFFLDAKLCDDDAPPHSLKVSGCKAM
jgi:hypothetical protein